MARLNVYVWSGATGTADGSTWANAYLTLQAAMNPGGGGDVYWVAHDHSELTAGASLQCWANHANPAKTVCVNRLGSVPPVAADRRTTAVVATSANGSITISNSCFYDGITFIAGNSTGAAFIDISGDYQWWRFDNCSFRLGSTGAGMIRFPSSNSWFSPYVELNNTTMSFSAANQVFQCNGVFKWSNTAPALLGVPPTALFALAINHGGNIELIGLDLSTLTGAIITDTTNTNAFSIRIVDCKLSASVNKSTAGLTRGSRTVDLIRSSSAGNYAVRSQRYAGVLDEETTVVRAPGGATDLTTPLSWKVATNTNAQYLTPFDCPPIAVWNDTVGSPVTAAVEGVWVGAAVPKNDEAWVELQYLSSSSSPLAVLVNDAKANWQATAAAQTASSATWSGFGAAPTAAYDPATATAVTLSGSNLVVTNTGTTTTDQGARGISALGQTSGKFYFETTITNQGAGGNVGCGICTTTAVYTSLGTSGAGGAQMYPASGNIWANGGNSGFSLGARATGQVIGIAVDLTNRKAWFKKVDGTPTNWNGNATHDPATTVGGVTIPAGTVLPSCTFGGTSGVAGIVFTSNFGATAFVGAVPSGFASGYPISSAKPFKLDVTFTPQQKGWLYARVRCAAPSLTFYIDPKVTLS